MIVFFKLVKKTNISVVIWNSEGEVVEKKGRKSEVVLGSSTYSKGLFGDSSFEVDVYWKYDKCYIV